MSASDPKETYKFLHSRRSLAIPGRVSFYLSVAVIFVCNKPLNAAAAGYVIKSLKFYLVCSLAQNS